MPIRFRCRCGQLFQPKDRHAGTRVRCPACGRAGRIPAPANQVSEGPPETDPRAEVEDHNGPSAPQSERHGSLSFWRDPVIVVGGAVPTLILLVFFVYLVRTHLATRNEPETPPGLRAHASGSATIATKTPSPQHRVARLPPLGDSSQKPSSTHSPTAWRLAKAEAGWDAGREDSVTLLVDGLLTQVDRLYEEDCGKIAELCLSMNEKIREVRRSSSVVDILDGSTRCNPPGYFGVGKPRSFAKFSETYMLFRVGDSHASHHDTIQVIREFANSMWPPEYSLTEEQVRAQHKTAKPGQRLASIEVGMVVPEEDPWVDRYQSLLEKASTCYRQDIEKLPALTLAAYCGLRAAGKLTFPDDVIGGAIQWKQSGRGNSAADSYEDFLNRFVALRIKTDMETDAVIKTMITRE